MPWPPAGAGSPNTCAEEPPDDRPHRTPARTNRRAGHPLRQPRAHLQRRGDRGGRPPGPRPRGRRPASWWPSSGPPARASRRCSASCPGSTPRAPGPPGSPAGTSLDDVARQRLAYRRPRWGSSSSRPTATCCPTSPPSRTSSCRWCWPGGPRRRASGPRPRDPRGPRRRRLRRPAARRALRRPAAAGGARRRASPTPRGCSSPTSRPASWTRASSDEVFAAHAAGQRRAGHHRRSSSPTTRSSASRSRGPSASATAGPPRRCCAVTARRRRRRRPAGRRGVRGPRPGRSHPAAPRRSRRRCDLRDRVRLDLETDHIGVLARRAADEAGDATSEAGPSASPATGTVSHAPGRGHGVSRTFGSGDARRTRPAGRLAHRRAGASWSPSGAAPARGKTTPAQRHRRPGPAGPRAGPGRRREVTAIGERGCWAAPRARRLRLPDLRPGADPLRGGERRGAAAAGAR